MTSAFADEPRRLRTLAELSYRQLASLSSVSHAQISDLEKGRRRPTPDIAKALDEALHACGRLTATMRTPAPDDVEGEPEAIELAQRAAASDASDETLKRIEKAFDQVAMAYATTAPAELLPRVRRHLRYIDQLLSGRATLAQRRRLLVVGAGCRCSARPCTSTCSNVPPLKPTSTRRPRSVQIDGLRWVGDATAPRPRNDRGSYRRPEVPSRRAS
ncbi:helix-turn-helix domain-containing protein [Actinoplanes siamensis]|uniref:HTH cro/C1-type domain-containing protein n=1 Tax=Actinoplanes siamensis TaxID=1223317 RepID=A0A919TJB7_9ACTN|nr:helix-turn-helix transcriptional regulator [Actinoplanes siamensis]GIF04463.1 hypothetical protein Asi03nite_20010 [Actinoplanes siamensis]